MEDGKGFIELFRILEILNNNGIDVTKIPFACRMGNGKRGYYSLNMIHQDGIDINIIIDENNLNGAFEIGKELTRMRKSYVNGTLNNKVKGLVEKYPAAMLILDKIRKSFIHQFYSDIVNANLADLIEGRLSNQEIMVIINKKAKKCGETPIENVITIKRIVAMILIEQPAEYEKYILAGGKDFQVSGISWKDREPIVIRKIIQEYFPRFLREELSLLDVAKELNVDAGTVSGIIKRYYANDQEMLERFRKRAASSAGMSAKRKEAIKDAREEVGSFKVVPKEDIFIALPEQKQDEQLIMKIRKLRFKEISSDTSDIQTYVLSEQYAKTVLERMKRYFKSKNDPKKEKEYFSERDIRLIVFGCTRLTGRSNDTLDEKFKVLTSFYDWEDISGMIKTFPDILSYSPERLKAQLNLLKSENLLDYVVSTPIGFRISPETMYALINFAKERHPDLSNINRRRIFMPNSTLKHDYKVTYDDIKEKYPLPPEMQVQKAKNGKKDCQYSVEGQKLGMVGVSASSETQEQVSVVMDGVLKDKLNQAGVIPKEEKL